MLYSRDIKEQLKSSVEGKKNKFYRPKPKIDWASFIDITYIVNIFSVWKLGKGRAEFLKLEWYLKILYL